MQEVGLASSCFGAVKVLHLVEVLDYRLDVSEFSCWLYCPNRIGHGQSEQVNECQSEENAIKTPSGSAWGAWFRDSQHTALWTSLSFPNCGVQSSECLFNSDSAAVNNISKLFPVGVSQGSTQHEWSTTLSSIGPENGAQLDKKILQNMHLMIFQNTQCIYPLMPIHNALWRTVQYDLWICHS